MNQHNNTRLFRLPQVLEITGFDKAWIYCLLGEGRFLVPKKIGIRAMEFLESKIDKGIKLTINFQGITPIKLNFNAEVDVYFKGFDVYF
ncbi:Predicted transcriptional regulator [Serratia quinivorans]|jgi:predicted DNA-binding transcriptional regulator AlpA|uniref:helix-turn-helix transcriptional regulator n=1 Tax=Serratia quinivorans TaxID=137545 RepID=UPI002177F6F3|nr:Predicted transcriptional regulator [Serratia quinivorans]CAI1574479.1 Predicted transcriptional regulator [Serratia quinivorans]CAI1643778.1 Predicted transcriptional regulator [Serratia quinivorans]CAI1730596.1 Predicted transcriptional regulator [Serratia quinivorans]CAI1767641.1 Predicted transcriptional regulator [Serratia quinivorans]